MRSIAPFLFCLLTSSAIAQTADDVDCVRCVDTNDIAPKAVTTAKIDNESVTVRKLAPGSVGTSKIRDGAITIDKLSAGLAAAVKSRWAVIDSNQVELPLLFISVPVGNSVTGTLLSAQGLAIPVSINPSKIIPTDSGLYYETDTCVGPPFAPNAGILLKTSYRVENDSIYEVLTVDMGQKIERSKTDALGVCADTGDGPWNTTYDVVLVDSIELNIYAPPFAADYRTD